MIWPRNVALSTGAMASQGNANPGTDGAVDGTDLAIWEEQFGTVVVAASAVPGPSTLTPVILGGALALIPAANRFRVLHSRDK